MPFNLEDARNLLLEHRAELVRLREISSDDRDAVNLDPRSVGRLSRMDALQAQAMAKANERQRAKELARIDAALRRIEQGEYGYCAVCGEEIAPQRLRADPAACVCIRCAR